MLYNPITKKIVVSMNVRFLEYKSWSDPENASTKIQQEEV